AATLGSGADDEVSVVSVVESSMKPATSLPAPAVKAAPAKKIAVRARPAARRRGVERRRRADAAGVSGESGASRLARLGAARSEPPSPERGEARDQSPM